MLLPLPPARCCRCMCRGSKDKARMTQQHTLRRPELFSSNASSSLLVANKAAVSESAHHVLHCLWLTPAGMRLRCLAAAASRHGALPNFIVKDAAQKESNEIIQKIKTEGEVERVESKAGIKEAQHHNGGHFLAAATAATAIFNDARPPIRSSIQHQEVAKRCSTGFLFV